MARRRSKRIRCHCCHRLMSCKPCKRGDAIRRRAPVASVCIDCEPRGQAHLPRRHYADVTRWCPTRGCTVASVIERLSVVVADD